MNSDKEKQWEGVIQDEDVFLYKPYDITSEHEWLKTSEPIFTQEEVNNLEKALRIL